MSKPVASVVRWVERQSLKIKSPLAPIPGSGGDQFNKNWVHPPDALNNGRVEYTVKFLGEVEVPQAKGTQVIKDAIQKIRFNLQLKRAQGYKIPKVEIHVSVDGLNIIDMKSKMILYKYPLHRISFCADDKQDKRVFSFIAKQADSEVHNCFVFLSDKLAEEITLTIGEAFDLAYRKFLDNNGKDLEMKKQTILLRKRIGELEQENSDLKARLSAYERSNSAVSLPPNAGQPQPPPLETLPTKLSKQASANWEDFGGDGQKNNANKVVVPQPPNANHPRRRSSGNANGDNRQIMNILSANGPAVGRKLENLQLDKMDDLFDDDFNPRAGEKPKPAARTTASNGVAAQNGTKDPFGLDPFLLSGLARNGNGVVAGAHNGHSLEDQPSDQELEQAISLIDSRLAEMREGFSRGLTIGITDFNLSDLDPLSTNANCSAPVSNVASNSLI